MRMMMKPSSKARTARRHSLGVVFLALVAGLGSAPLLAQDSETIVAVEVEGASKQSPETVLYKAGIKVGDDLRTADLSEVLERLWTSGAYDDIKFEVEDVDGGKKLIIHVVERPIVKEVVYRGGTLVGVSSLKDKIKDAKLGIPADSVYDPEAARKIKMLIVEKCAEKGYRNPVVSVDLEPVAKGVSRLVFDIKEGGKVRIYKIAFRGNTAISSAKLRKTMMKIRTHWMLSWMTSRDLLVDSNLEEDLQNLKKAYWRIGYKDVFIGQPAIQIDDFTTASMREKNEKRISEGKSPKYDLRATLTIPILEGERYYEGTFRVEGNDRVFKGRKGEDLFRTQIAVARRDHHSWWAKFFGIKPDIRDLPPGKLRPFDLDAVNEGVDKMHDEYGNKAHVMFRAEKKLDVREEGGVKKVDVLLKVDEGEAYTIRRIDFEGNTTTKDRVLRREVMVKEGGPFRLDLFRESFTSVGQLGFFDIKGREPKVEFVPDKPQVDLTFRGQEAGTNEIMFQGGYGSVLGFSAGASYSTRNLGGNGETLSVNFNKGQYQKSASIDFTEPYLFDLPYSLTSSISSSTTEYAASRVGADNAYTQKSRGFSSMLGVRLSQWFPNPVWAYFTTYRVGYSLRRDHFEGGINYLYRDIGDLTTSTITQSLTYSTIDHPYRPTTGVRLSVGFDLAQGWLGTTRPYHRTTLEASRYFSLGERQVLAMSASYGYIKNMSAKGIPLFDYYRPGGESSIRGYQYGQVGSIYYDNSGKAVVVGGNKQFVANFEYQFKISEDIRAVLFFDAGNAWGPGEPMFNDREMHYYNPTTGMDVVYTNPKLLRSTGIEFRIYIPISPAPLRLIWARKLNPYPFDTSSSTDFQFSIGTMF